MIKNLTLPISHELAHSLKAGERVMLSGVVYTARDAAHKRIVKAIEEGEELPFDLDCAAVYYAGPCPSKLGQAIGSCGPTTSSRCDPYTPLLIDKGLTVMIGKGGRSKEVIDKMKGAGTVYLSAIGGAGALYSTCVISAETVAYPDLGAEAVRRLTIKNMPAIVATDDCGNSILR